MTIINFIVTPPLTTFNQPRYEIGQEAAKMMLKLLENRENEELNMAEGDIVVLRGELIVRGSTAPPSSSS